jgi:hypothetical protein
MGSSSTNSDSAASHEKCRESARYIVMVVKPIIYTMFCFCILYHELSILIYYICIN